MFRRNNTISTFSRPRRRFSFPIGRILALLVFIGLLALLWVRGGERPQQLVEKEIAASRLGQ